MMILVIFVIFVIAFEKVLMGHISHQTDDVTQTNNSNDSHHPDCCDVVVV